MKHWVFGGEPLFYGVTLITPFFIIFPRDLFLNKPDGAVNYFTNFVSPGYWEVGGSLPVIIINEFIMNFGLIGCVIFVLFVYFINYIFLFKFNN